MARSRHLHAVEAGGPAGVSIAEAISSYLRWLSTKRGRSGRVTSPQTIRSYESALPKAFAGITTVGALADQAGAQRLRANIRTAWGGKAPATVNAKRAAVASALAHFREQGWLDPGADPLAGLGREHEPKPGDRVRDRGAIDRLLTAKSRPLQDRALFALLYSSAARCEEVLSLNVTDLDRANRRAQVTRKGGRPDELMYDTRTARLLGQLLGRRTRGPVFLSDRTPRDGTVRGDDLDPESGHRRMTYRTAARRLAAATGGWTPHDLRHSRLTHAGEDGATEADLLNLSGHEDRRTLQRYLRPSKEGTHKRLDDLDVARGSWTPDTSEIAARLTAVDAEQIPGQTAVPLPGHDTSDVPDEPAPPEHGPETSTTSSTPSPTPPETTQTSSPTPRSRSATPASKPSGRTRVRRRHYTSEQLNNYQLEPVRGEAGQILGYTVLVAGDRLGTIARPGYGHRGWQAQTTTGRTCPHSGTGRYAGSRQTAVIDLLLELGITSNTR